MREGHAMTYANSHRRIKWSADRAAQLAFFLAITAASISFGTYSAIPFAVGMIGWVAWRNRN
jgi:hypothetical protein